MIDLVNKTNNKLLYAEFLSKSHSKDDDYRLLNALELLWSVDGKK
jgi:hypothetical protein